MNVLGGPLTILCLSAGHLLGSGVVWQLQLACYCVSGCVSVSPWAFAPFHTATKAGNLIIPSVIPQKTWHRSPSGRESVRRSPRTRRLAFHLLPYDTPHAHTSRYNPEFHIDRTHTAGGDIEQTETALRIYRYID